MTALARMVMWAAANIHSPLEGLSGDWYYSTEPIDVPAIQETRRECKPTGAIICFDTVGSACPCGYSYQDVPEWTCQDKSRILLTDENGGKHCVKFK